MKRRTAIIALLITGSMLLAPTTDAASRFQIRLPDCERTVYTIVNKQKDAQTMSPDVYDAKAAADPAFKETWTVAEVTTSGDCRLDDFFQLFANVSTWGFSILAAVALFFFIWGGFTLLIAGGRSEKVEEGKKILNGTFMGVLVVLTAWILVNAFIIGFSGGKFIFPNSPFQRSGLGSTSSQCRASYLTKYSQTGCTGNDLHFGCADPTTGDGAVTQLQTLLKQKCPSLGSVDGCYGKDTAFSLWAFLAANGYQPLPAPDKTTKLRWNSNFLRLLQDPATKDCAAVYGEPEIIEPPAPSGEAPATDPGCCVPGVSSLGFSCIEAPATQICPVDDPTVQPEFLRPGYRYFPNACPSLVGVCDVGCCVKFRSDGRRDCETCSSATNCTGGSFFLQGFCPFSGNVCVSADTCT